MKGDEGGDAMANGGRRASQKSPTVYIASPHWSLGDEPIVFRASRKVRTWVGVGMRVRVRVREPNVQRVKEVQMHASRKARCVHMGRSARAHALDVECAALGRCMHIGRPGAFMKEVRTRLMLSVPLLGDACT